MAFTVLAVRGGDEPADELYPDPGDEPDTVELEDDDGDSPDFYWAKSVAVAALPSVGMPQQIAKLTDLSVGVMITDSRVAIACSKYDKGGGYGGWGVGLLVAAGANAVSRARAARRRKGKMLVGHVRYEWLGFIDAKDRSGLLSANTLGLLLGDPTGVDEAVTLALTLDKHTPATMLAEEISSRAATYLAEHYSDDATRPALLAYAEEPIAHPVDGALRYELPAAVR